MAAWWCCSNGLGFPTLLCMLKAACTACGALSSVHAGNPGTPPSAGLGMASAAACRAAMSRSPAARSASSPRVSAAASLCRPLHRRLHRPAAAAHHLARAPGQHTIQVSCHERGGSHYVSSLTMCLDNGSLDDGRQEHVLSRVLATGVCLYLPWIRQVGAGENGL